MPQSLSYRCAAAAGAAIAAAAAVLISGGCAAIRTDAVPATEKAEAPAAVQADAPSALRLHPLTGLPVEERESAAAASAALTQRPIMVMINNHAAARPQSGLSRADVLVECLAEGEITRIAAFYEGGTNVPGMIGPVRSIRPYYIDLGRMFDAIEVHAGGSPDAYEQLGDMRIDHMDEITNAGRFFWRESFRKLPHNLYTDMPHLRAGAARLQLRAEPLRRPALAFAQAGKLGAQASAAATAAAGIAGVKAASHLDVTFQIPSYVVSYTYDLRAGTYSRLVNGRPHTDLNDGSQLAAANVAVLGADHKILDAEGRRDVRLTGGGPAVIFRNGVAVQGTWRRGAAEDTFHLAAADGRRVTLAPGRTHYLIVPNKPTFAGHLRY